MGIKSRITSSEFDLKGVQTITGFEIDGIAISVADFEDIQRQFAEGSKIITLAPLGGAENQRVAFPDAKEVCQQRIVRDRKGPGGTDRMEMCGKTRPCPDHPDQK